MLIISKPLSADQVRTYHAEEFSNARENDFTSSDRIYGQWHGHLARQWGLSGDVRTEQVVRLAEGLPTDQRTASRPASDSAGICEWPRPEGDDDGASRRVGRDVLGAEECVVDRARRRR